MLGPITALYLSLATPDHIPSVTPVQYTKPVQPYTRWGKLAMTEAQKRYPTAAIVDYLHVGRVTYTSTYAKETFKFWLKADKREWGVFVNIYFDPVNNEVQQILFCESAH